MRYIDKLLLFRAKSLDYRTDFENFHADVLMYYKPAVSDSQFKDLQNACDPFNLFRVIGSIESTLQKSLEQIDIDHQVMNKQISDWYADTEQSPQH